jgi:hypothetical protein
MGGSGSGNWYRFDSKALVEGCLSIDIRQMSRSGCLEPWQRYSWKWQNGCDITIGTQPDAIELFYSISYNGKPHEDVNYKVPLSWTSCSYGGKRPWFICPGKSCGRRVAKLYLAGRYFLCRHCHDLVYSSQRQAKEFRLMDKAQKIYRRLGVDSHNDLFLESKPKGMHQTTYNDLIEKAQGLESEALQAMNMRLRSFGTLHLRLIGDTRAN